MERPTLLTSLAAVAVTAGVGGVLTTPKSPWYRSLHKPRWQPPAAAFGPVWTALYGLLGYAIAETWDRSDLRARRTLAPAVAVNLLLNAGWNATFFRAHQLWPAAAHAAVLEASTLDLIRRSARVSGRAAGALVPYAIWGGFAAVLSADIARRNSACTSGRRSARPSERA